MNNKITRAALIAAFVFSAVIQAKTSPEVRESASDIIEKSQNLILQKDRQQALLVLSSAIRREKSKLNIQNLKQAFDQISTVFLSDRAQQLFEGSISLRKVDVLQAQQRLQEAQALESENLNLLLEQARIHIIKSECKNAENLIRAWEKKYLGNILTDLVLFQSQVCSKSFVASTSVKAPNLLFKKDDEDNLFWLISTMDRLDPLADRIKFLDFISRIKKVAPNYPDLFHWQSKIEQKTNSRNILFEKYLMACKNISAASYRQYMMDPLICRRGLD